MRPRQPTIKMLGGAYASAGGMTKASTTRQAPKTEKIRGKTVKRLIPAKLKNETRISPTKIIRKTPALRGAQGRRFIADSINLGPSLFIVLLHSDGWRRPKSDVLVDV